MQSSYGMEHKGSDKIMGSDFLNVKQVAEKLGIRPVTLYKWLREGKLKGTYFKIGGVFRFSLQPLEKYLEDMINND